MAENKVKQEYQIWVRDDLEYVVFTTEDYSLAVKKAKDYSSRKYKGKKPKVWITIITGFTIWRNNK